MGKEVTSGGFHLQGYVEFGRNYMISHCRSMLPTVHWEPAIKNSVANFTYCSKSGIFKTIGNFNKEIAVISSSAAPSIGMVMRGLLDKKLRDQVLVSKQYSEKMQFFDKACNRIQTIRQKAEFYKSWSQKLLYPWQFQALRLIMEQDSRQVMWVYDPAGNNGKSFLAFFLSICYGFTMLDGTISPRDLGTLLSHDLEGIVMDVSRAGVKNLSYGALESVKNGFIVSGKYHGCVKMFPSPKCVVFANAHPDMTMLSPDRWCIYTLGKDELRDVSKMSVVALSSQFPFLPPPIVPVLDDDFDLRKYLLENLEGPEANNETSGKLNVV